MRPHPPEVKFLKFEMKFEMLFIAVNYVLAMQLNCKPIMPLFIQLLNSNMTR